MKIRLCTALVSCVVALPAFANSGFTPGAGESSGNFHAMPASQTRTQVLAELTAWKRNSASPDGWKFVDGEAGWAFVGQSSTGTTRAQVRQELADWRRNPVSADGWQTVDGEAGGFYSASTGRAAASPAQARARHEPPTRAAIAGK